MKKCMVVINNTGIGGAEKRLARVFLYLSLRDPDLYLVVNEGLEGRLRQAGIELAGNLFVLREKTQGVSRKEASVRLPRFIYSVKDFIGASFYFGKMDYARWWLPLRRFIDQEKIGLIHAVLGGVYVAFPLFWRKGIRSVISVVSLDLRLTIGSRWGYPLYFLALRKCDRIDALSEGIRQSLFQNGLSESKVLVSPCSFTDIRRYRPSPQKRDWVVFAGRFVLEKNPVLFLKAIPRVLSVFPKALFFLLGEGPLQKEIEREADRLGIRERARVGFLPDVGSILSESKVFVSLQKHNNYPSQSLLEAMACENAVVATDRGETNRLVTPDLGILVEEDEEELASAVIKLLQNEPKRREMGKRARATVEKEHYIERFADHLACLYRQLL